MPIVSFAYNDYYRDEPSPLFLLLLIIFAILNLILFFKIWGMTNNVKKIETYINPFSEDINIYSKYYLTKILKGQKEADDYINLIILTDIKEELDNVKRKFWLTFYDRKNSEIISKNLPFWFCQ